MPTIENYGIIASHPVTVDGVTRPLREWADIYGLPYKTVSMRWTRGYRDPKKLFYKPHHVKDATNTWVYVNGPKNA